MAMKAIELKHTTHGRSSRGDISFSAAALLDTCYFPLAVAGKWPEARLVGLAIEDINVSRPPPAAKHPYFELRILGETVIQGECYASTSMLKVNAVTINRVSDGGRAIEIIAQGGKGFNWTLSYTLQFVHEA